VFIATTAPSKIIPTLKRRFTHYQLKPVNSQDLFMYLVKVAKQYEIKLHKDTLDLIIEQANGSPAVALSLLNTIMESSVDEQEALLSYAKNNTENILKLCQALLYGKTWSSMIPLIEALDDSPEGYRRTIQAYMLKVLLNPKSGKLHMRAASILDIFSTYIDNKADFVVGCYKCTI
jgi:DNA polymerase III gamma/tau subunit